MELDSTTLDQINKIKERCQAIKPLVVIRCITYNHEPYIKDALEGFLMQKTDFPFVAIVHDDASTDNTAGIVREYAEKYPDIIFPIFETKNQYSKRDGSLGEIMKTAQDATGAKYIAFCEGDDYWTDPLKLQKQVDILELDSSVTLSFHSVNEILKNKSKIRALVFNRYYSGVEYFLNKPGQTASFVIRAEIYKSNIYRDIFNSNIFSVGDIPLVLVCASIGNLRGLSDIMSVYRHIPSGWSMKTRDKESQWNLIKEQLEYKRFGKEYKNVAEKSAQELCISLFFYNLKKHRLSLDFLSYSFRLSLKGTFSAIKKVFKNYYYWKIVK